MKALATKHTLGSRIALGAVRWVGMVFFSGIILLAGAPPEAAGQNPSPLWAWGNGTAFELGNGECGQGSPYSELTPIKSTTLNDFLAMAGGTGFTIALRDDRSVWGWGSNSNGQLMESSDIQSHTPFPVNLGGFTDVVAIAAGGSTVAVVKANGTVWTWGINYSGQLGDGTTTERSYAVQVLGPGEEQFLTDVFAVAVSGDHMVAIKTDGTVWAWGWNEDGQLGDGTTTDRSRPVQVIGPDGEGFLTGITAVAASRHHSIARKSDGTVWAWGRNVGGQLGDGTNDNSTHPVQASGLTGIVAVAAADSLASSLPFPPRCHSVALRGSDGAVFAWGWNNHGQLGDGTITNRNTPVQVSGLTNVVAIASGGSRVLAIKDSAGARSIWAWGCNDYGELGDGTTTERHTPVQVSGLAKATAIAAGRYHSLALAPTIEVSAEDDLDWVYQNTTGILANGGHKIRITVDVNNNPDTALAIAKKAGSGNGAVTIEADPGSNPLVKYIVGSMRSDGTADTGALILEVQATGDVYTDTVEMPFTCRRLGDVDGNGAPEPGDVSLLIMKLNGNPPAGYHDNAFDLDGNGGAEPGDVQILINILNGLPIP